MAGGSKSNDYSIFSPHLSTIVSLTKEKISELGFDDHPYDPLINEFEPGMTVKKLDDLFNPLKIATIDFLSCHQPTKYRSIQGPFESNVQIQYSKELMAAMGYNTDSGGWTYLLTPSPLIFILPMSELQLE